MLDFTQLLSQGQDTYTTDGTRQTGTADTSVNLRLYLGQILPSFPFDIIHVLKVQLPGNGVYAHACVSMDFLKPDGVEDGSGMNLLFAGLLTIVLHTLFQIQNRIPRWPAYTYLPLWV